MSWKEQGTPSRSSDTPDRTYHLAGVTARNHLSANAHEVEIGHSYNGSSPATFGGATRWPRVRVECALPEFRRDLAEQLASRLMNTIEQFTQEQGLTTVECYQAQQGSR